MGGSYNGDDVTVNVAAGTYTENDSIDASSLNSLAIAGAGASSTTVNGGGSEGAERWSASGVQAR